MAVEKELKLALDGANVDDIVRFLDTLSGRQGETITLGNIYFDTPDQSLAGAKIALRLRKTASGWLQTLKTAGHASEGMHTRGEWEMPVAGEKLELDALLAACDDPAAAGALTAHADKLGPMFRTDFNRTLWHVTHDGAEIEIALDIGRVLAGDDDASSHGVPIEEIELELKSGAESELLALAQDLRAAVPRLRPDDVSKAARGYRLLRERAAQAGTRGGRVDGPANA